MTKDFVHYLPLVGIFFLAVVGFALFPYDKDFQIVIVVSASVAYVFWGIIHHLIHNDLHLETLIEYLVIAILGAVSVLTLLIRV